LRKYEIESENDERKIASPSIFSSSEQVSQKSSENSQFKENHKIGNIVCKIKKKEVKLQNTKNILKDF
jgi:hypothetical protein